MAGLVLCHADGPLSRADAANLAASEEWGKLATTHEARVKELEPLVDTLKAYATFIEGVLESTIKKLGKGAKSAVAGLPEGMTAMDKLNWLNTNETLFEEPTVVLPASLVRVYAWDQREFAVKVK